MTAVRRLLLAGLAVLLVLAGAVPAAATTGTDDTVAYAEIVVPSTGTTQVRIALGRPDGFTRLHMDKHWSEDAYRDFIGNAGVPTGTVVVTQGTRALGTFEVVGGPAAGHGHVVVDVPGAVYGTSLQVRYSGDTQYAPVTHSLTVVEPSVQLQPTIDRITPHGDGVFKVEGSIHIPARGTTVTPFEASQIEVRPLGAAGGKWLTRTHTATLGTPVASTLPGFATRRTWVIDRVALEFAEKAQVNVVVDAPPYYTRSPNSSWAGNTSTDTLQLDVQVHGGTIEVSHLKSVDDCNLVRSVRVDTDVSTGTTGRLTRQAEGVHCRGTLPLPQVPGMTKIGLHVSWPRDAPMVWLPVDRSLPARSVRLDHASSSTTQTVTVTSSPTARTTVLQSLDPSGAWVEIERSTSQRPSFHVPRTAQATQYRVHVPQDAAGQGALAGPFTVRTDPPRGKETQVFGMFHTYGLCMKEGQRQVDASQGHWTSMSCMAQRSPMLTTYLGRLKYKP